MSEQIATAKPAPVKLTWKPVSMSDYKAPAIAAEYLPQLIRACDEALKTVLQGQPLEITVEGVKPVSVYYTAKTLVGSETRFKGKIWPSVRGDHLYLVKDTGVHKARNTKGRGSKPKA